MSFCTHATPLRVRTRAGRAPLAVNFTDLSTGSSASWNWSFADGLWDGVEAGQFWMVNGMRFYNINSNPTSVDSDGDGLNDYIELVDEGTHPLMKDSDDDAWTDGEEVNHVIWPLRTEPLMPDTDEDGLIDSIDPDPLDAMNNTMPAEWHRSEFVQGLILSDISSSDPRHRNEAFSWGQDISQLACFGSARDLIAQAYNGKRGPHLMVLLAGSIPVGNLAKAEMKAITYVSKFDDPALRLTKFSRYSTNMGLFSGNKMGYLRDVVDKEGAIPGIIAHGGTEAGVIRIADSAATMKTEVSYQKIQTFLETPATGKFAPKTRETAEACLERKWNSHKNDQSWINKPATKEEYLQRGTNLLNRRDAGVELYYQDGYDTLVVYDRNANEFVSGRISGDIITYYAPDNSIEHYVDITIRNRLIQIN
jgi:hypothetical protein